MHSTCFSWAGSKGSYQGFFTASLMLTLCLSLDCFATYRIFSFYNSFRFTLTQAFVGACTVNASRKSWFLRSACTLLPEPYRKLLSLDSFALHILLYCVLTYNRRGNSYMYRWLARSANACLTANRKNTWANSFSSQFVLPWKAPYIICMCWILASASNWCNAMLVLQLKFLESENLLRSYHSRPPPSLLSQRHRDRLTSEPDEYTSIL